MGRRKCTMNTNFSSTNPNNLGVKLVSQGKYDEAILIIEKALMINPSSYDTYFNLGMVLQLVGNNKRAITCFENALKINPKILDAAIFLYYQYRKFCIWDRLEILNEKINKLSADNFNRKRGYGETPFRNLVRVDDPKLNKLGAKVFADEIVISFQEEKERLSFVHKSRTGKKGRLGHFARTLRD